MKSNKNLVLIGMMGSGKSTLGRLLAKKLNLSFFDIDFIIETKLRIKISEIFQKKGEIFFRNLEEKISLQFIDKGKSVISLGGGAFTNDIIRKNIQKKSISIWLDWNERTLINRIRKNKKRPIALNLNDNEIKELMNIRSNVYAKSKYKIVCDGMTKTQIIKKIIQIYETN